MTCAVQAENLGKSYGDFRAVSGISFSIQQGECFGFLGENGAGKSTTMRMIYGLSKVDEGNLTVLGTPVRLTPPSVKARLGVVPQENNLDPDLNVLENLVVYGKHFGLNREEAIGRGRELLDFVGLEDWEEEQVEDLSGGLKRRLVIARALINRPELVILDEPTTGLDPQARRLVWQQLRQLREEGVTLVLTSHYMEEAAFLCDRLVIMDEGQILTEGSPAELVERYVKPFVIEIKQAVDTLPPHLFEWVRAFGAEVEEAYHGLYFFTQDGVALWHKLDDWGLPRPNRLLRPSSLEDVYLKLTGRGMVR